MSAGKWKTLGEYGEKFESVRVPKTCTSDYWKSLELVCLLEMVDSRRVSRKGRIHVSTKKLSYRLPENGRISVCVGKWWTQGEYREKVESMRVPKNCPGDYWKRVESVRLPDNGRLRATTWKR